MRGIGISAIVITAFALMALDPFVARSQSPAAEAFPAAPSPATSPSIADSTPSIEFGEGAAATAAAGIRAAVSPAPTPSPYSVRPKRVTIGVVRDGPSWQLDQLTSAVERELKVLTKGEFPVSFVSLPSFTAGWNIAGVEHALKAALRDPNVDIVLAMGLLVSEAAARPDIRLEKPVMGGIILDSDLTTLPLDESGRSTKPNFSFVVSSLRVKDDLEAFHAMIPFRTLHVLADGRWVSGTNGFHGAFERLGKEMNFTPVLVPMGETADDALARLQGDVEAVYLTPPVRMSRAEKRALIEGINKRKIPSFSLRGLPDVEIGILAGISPRSTRLLARRIALNVVRLAKGEKTDSLPVHIMLQKGLVVNAATAAEIGYSPDFETIMTAEFLHREALEKGDPLSLMQAMEIAAEQNIDLAIRNAEVRASKQDRNRAFSFLLPQVGGNMDYERVDKDRAQASLGQLAEWRSLLGFQVNQILFDDEVFSNWRASKRTYRRRLYEEDDLRLDIVGLAASRYFDYLSAKLILRVEIDNLKLTKSNLDLARVRYRVGKAGKEEVYRWEAQLARNRSSVLEAESAEQRARVALNQTLGLDQDHQWKTKDIVLGDDDYYFMDNRLRGVIGNEAQLERFMRFAVDDAFANSPALMAVGQAIDAQRIALNQLKRKFGLPSFSGVFMLDHTMDRHRVNPPGGVPGNYNPFLPDRDDWFLGIGATLPLFEGGGRFFDVYKARADLDKLSGTQERLKQLIEKRTLTALYRMQSSHPNIRLSRRAADRAHRNLEIVTKKYGQGLVSILDLLDAQNQALQEDRAAAIAVYGYLKDLYEFQRSISWFQDFKTPEEKDVWIAALNDFMKKSPATP